MIRVAIVGDYNPEFESHIATGESIARAAAALGCEAKSEWLPTTQVSNDNLRQFDAVWASPGSPYKSFSGMLTAIRYARERGKPFVAT